MSNDSDNNVVFHVSVNSVNFIDEEEHSREQSTDFNKRDLDPLNNEYPAADSNSVASLGEKNQVISCGDNRRVNTTTKNVDLGTTHKLEEGLSKRRRENTTLKVKNGSTITEKNRHHYLSKNSTPCPVLTRRDWCLKGNRCDFLHQKFHNGETKNDKPCPFLQRRAFV